MACKMLLERAKQNVSVANDMIKSLQIELNQLNKYYIQMMTEELKQENENLCVQVSNARARLIELETKNGIQQISLPGSTTVFKRELSDKPANLETNQTEKKALKENETKAPKEKKVKEKKTTPATTEELPVDVGRLDLRIGKIVQVEKHPDADSLYVLKIDCGENQLRTVCSGLVKYVKIEELQNRSVVVLCNLKPVKMRGITSEAMVMCASSPDCVEVLLPPNSSTAGDFIECDGFIRQPDSVMNPKKKIFETVQPDLHTNSKLEACYKSIPLNVTGKGVILAKSLVNCQIK